MENINVAICVKRRKKIKRISKKYREVRKSQYNNCDMIIKQFFNCDVRINQFFNYDLINYAIQLYNIKSPYFRQTE